MDDTYLKTLFWFLVGLYTIAAIGVWENFAEPIFGLFVNYLYPQIIIGLNFLVKYV